MGDAGCTCDRVAPLRDTQWSDTLLRRDDGKWRRDHDFVSVASSVLQRRALVRGVRGLIARSDYRGWSQQLLEVDPAQLRATLDVINERGSVRDALRSAEVPACVRSMLRMMRLVESQVRGTDGYSKTRVSSRGLMALP